ncbi:hypothetical protein AX16_009714, partial [Volvariella volvacea WC 439]
MTSNQPKTPVHSHPLSPEQALPPSRGRRTRGTTQDVESNNLKPANNYFTLKAQLEQQTSAVEPNDGASWDGSMRGYGKARSIDVPGASAASRKASATSLAGTWDSQSPQTTAQPPLFIAGSSKDALNSTAGGAARRAPRRGPDLLVITEADQPTFGLSQTAATQILSTRWHEQSDEAIHSAIANINLASPSAPSRDSHGDSSYMSILRVLSNTMHNLSQVRMELEENLRSLKEKEAARRVRAEAVVRELESSNQDVAKRIQAIFAEDDEVLSHQIRKQQSRLSLVESLSEAIADDVIISRSFEENSTPIISTSVPPSTLRSQLDRRKGQPLNSHSQVSSDSTVSTVTVVSVDPKDEAQRGVHQQRGQHLPQPQPQQRPDRPSSSIGDWMGTLWGRGKPKSQSRVSSPSIQSQSSASVGAGDSDANSTSRSQSQSQSQPDSANEGRTAPVPDHQRRPNRPRRSSKSVFGTLGISILNPIPSPPSASVDAKKHAHIVGDASSVAATATTTTTTITTATTTAAATATPPAAEAGATTISIISDGASIRSSDTNAARSANSLAPSLMASPSPLQPTFNPTAIPAAPHLTTTTTSLLNPATAADGTSITSTTFEEEIALPIMRQGASLRAIANATRVMTNDPGSILADQGRESGELIKKLAMELIRNAREKGVVFRERPNLGKERRDHRGEYHYHHYHGGVDGSGGELVATLSPSAGGAPDAALTLKHALALNGHGGVGKEGAGGGGGKGLDKGRRSTPSLRQFAAPFALSPYLFSSFMNQQQRKSSSSSSSSDPTSSSSSPSNPHSRNTPSSLSSVYDSANINSIIRQGLPSTALGTTAGIAGLPQPPSMAPFGAQKPLSVPLESIIPATAKPPTHYLSKSYYTPLASKDFRSRFAGSAIHHPHRHPSFGSDTGFVGSPPGDRSLSPTGHLRGLSQDQEMLRDRYGFIYDVSQYDLLLLVRARECGSTAPACLTGVRIADRAEDNLWPGGGGSGGAVSVDSEGEEDREEGEEGEGGKPIRNGKIEIEIVKGHCDCDGSGVPPPKPNHEEDEEGGEGVGENGETGGEGGETRSLSAKSIKSRSSSKSRKATRPPMNRANTNSSHVNKSSNGGHATPQALPASSILVVTQSTPRHVCANTIRKLLDQLIEIHDQNQKSQRKEWDAFVKQRGKVIRANVTTSVGGAKAHTAGVSGLAGAAAILGLGLSNEDEDELSHTEGLIGFAQLGTSSERR